MVLRIEILALPMEVESSHDGRSQEPPFRENAHRKILDNLVWPCVVALPHLVQLVEKTADLKASQSRLMNKLACDGGWGRTNRLRSITRRIVQAMYESRFFSQDSHLLVDGDTDPIGQPTRLGYVLPELLNSDRRTKDEAKPPIGRGTAHPPIHSVRTFRDRADLRQTQPAIKVEHCRTVPGDREGVASMPNKIDFSLAHANLLLHKKATCRPDPTRLRPR
ncbi:hypothetical protein ABH999_000726 [Bradyrhizobium yuanmingense]